ncbi:MAG: GlsB/YeaQ/YmgE family stress response membrane protein [Caldilineaceae bacterium]
MINFLIWIILGGILGWLASLIMNTDASQGTLLNIIVGIVGAFVAGLVLTPLFGVGTINQNNFSIPALIVSLLGAVILLGIVNLFRRGTVR